MVEPVSSPRPGRASVDPTQPSPVERTATIQEGTTLEGRYVLRRKLAVGGMAEVWRADDTVLTRPVAVKVLLPHLAADPLFVARFRREAVAVARLTHPSIVSIYHTCDDPEAIVMELVEGRTLREELDRRGRLPVDEAVHIVAAVAEALEAAHRASIVHRDMKPANVLLGVDGQVKVTDFGIAKARTPDPSMPDVTTTGVWVGTAKYVSPEAVLGQPADARSDVYSLGVMLYELLCGRPPFDEGNDQATAVARTRTDPPRLRLLLRTVPHRIDDIVMKMLERHPPDRYQSAADVRADLLAAPTTDDVVVATADPTTVRETAREYVRAERRWMVPTLLVVLIAVALGVAGMLIRGSDVTRTLADVLDRVTAGTESTRSAEPEPVPLTARAYDPFGTGGERDELAPLAVDGDPTTEWYTENYRTRLFGNLKEGVGLIVSTDPATLDRLLVTSPSVGWSMRIHAATDPGETLVDWGPPIATVTDIAAGTTEVDLGGVEADSVLVWITDLGTGPGVSVRIGDITVFGR